jgi:hypothetical protein
MELFRRLKMRTYCLMGAATVIALFVGSTPAAADVILISHNRSVSASVSNPPVSDSETAPGAGPFSSTVEVQDGAGTSRAIASQASSFDALGTTLIAVGSVEGRLETLPGVTGSAESLFELQFTLDAPGSYTLLGEGSVSGSSPDPGFYASYIVRLSGPGGTVFDFRDEGPPLVPAVESGALLPGNYTFTARGLSGGAGNINAGGQADFTFTVTSPDGGIVAVPLPGVLAMGLILGAIAQARRRR